MHDLGLVAIWDDGDDLHAEPRAPYPHAREVLLTRAQLEGAAALVGGFARSVEAEQLLRTGWAHEIAPPREALRERGHRRRRRRHRPRARAATRWPAAARMPKQVHDAVAAGLERGPVLRADAAPRVRRVAGLRALPHAGPLRRLHRAAGGVRPGRAAGLPLVRHGRRRPGPAPCVATAACARRCVGDGVPPRSSAAPSRPPRCVASGGDHVRRPSVPTGPRSWWRPRAPSRWPTGGYAAVVLLDTWLALARPDLRTDEEALRRWADAAGAGPARAARGGRVGDPAHPALQALVRWDPAGFAEREARRRAPRPTCRRPAGSPRSPASPGPSTTR